MFHIYVRENPMGTSLGPLISWSVKANTSKPSLGFNPKTFIAGLLALEHTPDKAKPYEVGFTYRANWHSYWKWPSTVSLSHWKLPFSIVMLVYQRVPVHIHSYTHDIPTKSHPIFTAGPSELLNAVPNKRGGANATNCSTAWKKPRKWPLVDLQFGQ